jgi:hypothetical protein
MCLFPCWRSISSTLLSVLTGISQTEALIAKFRLADAAFHVLLGTHRPANH